MKTWSPDTCGCKVEEVYAGTAIVGMGQVLRKCTAHEAVPDDLLYGVLLANPDGENRRKNNLEKMLVETTALQLGEPFEGAYRWRVGIGFAWSWSGSGERRVLNIEITGAMLTAARKTQVEQWCAASFGPGKVLVV